MTPGLFVYGTLHPDRAPAEIREVVEQMTPIGTGTVLGEVHDLGEYPALASKGQRKPVRGSLFALPKNADALRKLDAYEEFDPQQPDTSLFRRRKRVVTLSDGRKQRHWVYVYNRELPRRVEPGTLPETHLNDTLNLFRRTSLLFAKYPLLWLPLVLSEVLRTILQWFSLPLTRAALLAAAPRSALGGNIAGPPPAWKINLISGSIAFVVMAISVLVLLYALGIVARALRSEADLRRHQPELHFQVPDGLVPTWLQVAGLSTLFFLFSAGFVSVVVAPWAARSHMTAGPVQALILSFVVPVMLVLLYLAVGPLRRFVLRVQSQPESHEGARLPYLLMLVAGALFSTLASLGIGYLTRRSMPAGGATQSLGLLTLQIMVAVVTAFPYAYAMTGLSLSPDGSLAHGEPAAE